MEVKVRRPLGWLLIVSLSCSPPPSPPDAGSAECQGVPARTLDQLFPAYFGATSPTSCVTGCHGVGLGSLKFTTAAELWQATNGKSSVSGDGPLVTPFSPSASWLFQKLKDTAAARCRKGARSSPRRSWPRSRGGSAPERPRHRGREGARGAGAAAT